MLSDFERKQMRERKKREEIAKTLAGKLALQYAEQQKKSAAERERILAMYTGGGANGRRSEIYGLIAERGEQRNLGYKFIRWGRPGLYWA